jgi:small subunit ribosomal protein S1
MSDTLNQNEPVNPANGDVEEDFASLVAQYEQSEVRDGEIVTGTILKIEKDWALVDIGYKSEGYVPLHEFLDPEGNLTIKVGDKTQVYVEARENKDGLVELSKDKAEKLKIWDEISAAAERDGVVEGIVLSRVKGGLTVDIGVKAFLPGSQIDLRPVRGLDRYLGQKLRFKVIKFNRRRGNIVLSRRVLLEKEREELKSKTLGLLEVGQTLEGTVMNITEYGCFVDLGGIDGLLHITDMSWGRINHPSEMVQVGDRVKVKILKFDPQSERVSLGMKQCCEDPWAIAGDRYNVDDRVKGKVVSLADYGAFIELEPGIEGLVHVSEMSWTKKVKHPSKILNVGDDVEAVVLQVDARNKRIALGLKQTEINPWNLLREKYPVGMIVTGKVRSITSFGIFVGVEDGIDGLIHLQDISWSRKIKNPADMFKKGDEVEAVVLHIDPDKERFALGIKQLSADPWEKVHDRYPIGSIVTGAVSKILDFGAIVELEDEVEGLVHVSEIRSEKVENVGRVLKVGDEVTAMVINLIPEERKLGLSIRRHLEAEDSGDYLEWVKAQKAAPTTIGDLIREKLDVSALPKAGGATKKKAATKAAAAAVVEPEVAPEPVAAPEPIVEETPEPEAAPEPVVEETPEPEAAPEPVVEETPEPEAAPEPVVEETPEPEAAPETEPEKA